MLGLNNVQIIGNLGGTPEMKYINNDDHVVNFSVAVNERWKNRNGESQERTTWLRIVFLILGSVGGFVALIRQIMRDSRDDGS